MPMRTASLAKHGIMAVVLFPMVTYAAEQPGNSPAQPTQTPQREPPIPNGPNDGQNTPSPPPNTPVLPLGDIPIPRDYCLYDGQTYSIGAVLPIPRGQMKCVPASPFWTILNEPNRKEPNSPSQSSTPAAPQS
jgi:hypothetical protein